MFQKSALVKRKEAIHKLLSNGYRFVTVQDEVTKRFFRYEYEAKHHIKRGVELVAIRSLLEMPNIRIAR